MANREIKFRAWDGERMYFNHSVSISIDGTVHFLSREGEWSEDTEKIIELMQYTGLKDRNGVEIYEGDIVKDCSESDLIFPVEWSQEPIGYCMPDQFSEDFIFPISSVELEVIGNIHQNPELLLR